MLRSAAAALIFCAVAQGATPPPLPLGDEVALALPPVALAPRDATVVATAAADWGFAAVFTELPPNWWSNGVKRRFLLRLDPDGKQIAPTVELQPAPFTTHIAVNGRDVGVLSDFYRRDVDTFGFGIAIVDESGAAHASSWFAPGISADVASNGDGYVVLVKNNRTLTAYRLDAAGAVTRERVLKKLMPLRPMSLVAANGEYLVVSRDAPGVAVRSLNPSSLELSAPIYLANAGADADFVEAAAGKNRIGIVWLEPNFGKPGTVWAAAYDRSGRALAPPGIAAVGAEGPHIGWSGDRFVVAYTTAAKDVALLDVDSGFAASPIALPVAHGKRLNPLLASRESGALLTYTEARADGSHVLPSPAHGIVVHHAAASGDSVISMRPRDQITANIIPVAGRRLVVWSELDIPPVIYVGALAADGVSLDGPPLEIRTTRDRAYPIIPVTDGKQLFLLWGETDATSGWSSTWDSSPMSNPQAMLIAPDLKSTRTLTHFLAPALTTGTSQFRVIGAGWDGSRFVVMWLDRWSYYDNVKLSPLDANAAATEPPFALPDVPAVDYAAIAGDGRRTVLFLSDAFSPPCTCGTDWWLFAAVYRGTFAKPEQTYETQRMRIPHIPSVALSPHGHFGAGPNGVLYDDARRTATPLDETWRAQYPHVLWDARGWFSVAAEARLLRVSEDGGVIAAATLPGSINESAMAGSSVVYLRDQRLYVRRIVE